MRKKGSGGVRRRRLEGRGPTPKAEDREYHPAYARKKAREAREAREAANAKARAGKKLPAALRIGEGHDLIVGRNPVLEAVTSGIPLTRVFMAVGNLSDDRLEETVRVAAERGAPVLEVTKAQLDAMSEGGVHQGVAIEVPPYEYADLGELLDGAEDQLDPGLFLALDSVTDPHNLGAAIRSASAFGVNGVIIPERRSAGVNATVWKVSAGAASRVPVARVTNLVRSLEEAKDRGYFVVGLDGDGEVELGNLELADMPLVLVTGSEGKGLARLTRDTCDQLCSIPIASEMESLNAAVATGIALYDVNRRRHS